jgi:hypothetical protein
MVKKRQRDGRAAYDLPNEGDSGIMFPYQNEDVADATVLRTLSSAKVPDGAAGPIFPTS